MTITERGMKEEALEALKAEALSRGWKPEFAEKWLTADMFYHEEEGYIACLALPLRSKGITVVALIRPDGSINHDDCTFMYEDTEFEVDCEAPADLFTSAEAARP
jgi:hypothetical protein